MHMTTDQSRTHADIPKRQRETALTTDHDQQSLARAPTHMPLSSEAEQHLAQSQWQAYAIKLRESPTTWSIFVGHAANHGKYYTACTCRKVSGRVYDSTTKVGANSDSIPTCASTTAVIFRRQQNAYNTRGGSQAQNLPSLHVMARLSNIFLFELVFLVTGYRCIVFKQC